MPNISEKSSVSISNKCPPVYGHYLEIYYMPIEFIWSWPKLRNLLISLSVQNRWIQNPSHILAPTQPADTAAFALMLGRPKVLWKTLGYWMCIAHCTARARTKNIKRNPGTSGPPFSDTLTNCIAALRDITRTYMRCRAVSIGLERQRDTIRSLRFAQLDCPESQREREFLNSQSSLIFFKRPKAARYVQGFIGVELSMPFKVFSY